MTTCRDDNHLGERSTKWQPEMDSSLTIASFNCKNINSNCIYVNKKLSNHDIVFLQELWTREDDNLTEIINCNGSHNTFHKAAVKNKSRGPHGGIGWVIKNELASEVNWKTSDHWCYNEGQLDTRIEYKIELNDILSLSNELREQEHNLLIIGDFTSDRFRLNSFYEILTNAITKNDLLLADLLYLKIS